MIPYLGGVRARRRARGVGADRSIDRAVTAMQIAAAGVRSRLATVQAAERVTARLAVR